MGDSKFSLAPGDPVDPPAAPLPSDQVFPAIQVLDAQRIICFTDYFAGGEAYEREQRITLLTGAEWKFQIVPIDGAGTIRTFDAAEYGLLVDGNELATINVPASSKRASFTLSLAGLAEGWHKLDVRSPAGETAVPWYAYMQTGAAPVVQDRMPVLMSSHGLHRVGGSKAVFAMVPAAFQPTTVPYPVRETPAFSDAAVDRRSLVQVDVVPWRPYDIHRTRDTNGVLNTANQQAYYFYSLTGTKYPGLACLDGPRGEGNAAMVTHLQLGRNGGLYFCDPWRVAHIEPNGTVRTLAGWRHHAPAKRPFPLNDPVTLRGALELVGDWSAVPDARRGFHEAWGMAWDARSLATDGNAVPIPNNGTLEKPHLSGPRLFVSDSQNGRVCLLTFDKASHETPVKVTEFLTGLADPWDVVCVDGALYVSERGAHRIAVYDATTGAFIRALVSGAALAHVDPASRFVRRDAAIDVIRAEQCVAPEGLYCLDGWLYFGSIAMGQVRRVDLTSGAVEVVVAEVPYSYAGTNFCKIAVSDGTFGPRGTVFAVTWSIANQGRPMAWTPDGKPWAWAGVGAGLSGPGRAWETLGYGSAVAVGQGRLIAGTSSEGITSHSRATPGEAVITNARWEVLRQAYENAGLHITHGPGGWGYYWLPLPWEISTEIDAYLTAHGHIKPA